MQFKKGLWGFSYLIRIKACTVFIKNLLHIKYYARSFTYSFHTTTLGGNYCLSSSSLKIRRLGHREVKLLMQDTELKSSEA